MTVIILIAAPTGLRGHLTRWMVEIAPGVFVGRITGRIRDLLWSTITSRIRRGQAILIRSATNEQRWSIETAGVDRWIPQDFDQLQLIRRPRAEESRPDRLPQKSRRRPNPPTSMIGPC